MITKFITMEEMTCTGKNLVFDIPSNQERLEPTVTIVTGNEFAVRVTTKEMPQKGIYVHQAQAVSKDDTFTSIVTGRYYEKVLELLYTAINNRTIERDYFRMYCDLLDGTINEEEFSDIIEKRENDFIVDETGEPDIETVSIALELAKRIRGVETINDLSSLFSFNPDKLELLANE